MKYDSSAFNYAILKMHDTEAFEELDTIDKLIVMETLEIFLTFYIEGCVAAMLDNPHKIH